MSEKQRNDFSRHIEQEKNMKVGEDLIVLCMIY